jgi:formylglycine-generating enzyme required for sulfatase activity
MLAGLAQLAFEMQRVSLSRQTGEGDSGALTALPLAKARKTLSETALYLAASASFISLGDEVRFTHQLLQEYFAARFLQMEVEAQRLNASALWPPNQWWQRSGWEETAILWAGLYSDDCTPVLDWVAEANPEVAAQCMLRSGAHYPVETLIRLRDQWLPRLTDLTRDPDPRARAAVGRAIGSLPPMNGIHMDTRKGVALLLPSPSRRGAASPLERGEVALPDIDWVRIPAGGFLYGEDKKIVTIRHDFAIARYPITYAQFQAFVDAPDGFANPRWWQGLAADEAHKRQPDEQWFKFWNHPRDTVSWYDAVAFCRWLSEALGYEVRLPTEHEWEYAARGRDGREYPYPGGFDPQKANTYRIGQTSAVGIYPNGASPFGVLDMSGNVWEWCLNKHAQPENIQLSGDASRVVRGGSWNLNHDSARAAYRLRLHPSFRFSYLGFRVVGVSAPVS